MALSPTPARSRAALAFAVVLSLAALGSELRAQTSLTTNYTGNTGSSCNMFEIKSLTGSLLTGFDIHFTGTATFEVWTLNTTGTYLGNESSNANWTLQGTAPNLVSLGMNTPTPMGLNLNIPIPAGVTQSVYITVTAAGGGTVWYNAGLTQGTLHASNSDLEVYVGNAGSYFNATIVGRGWNGTVYYSPLATVNDDMSLDAITAPTGQDLNCSATLTAAETVSVSVRNTGINTVAAGSTLLLSYQIDGGPVITEAALLATSLSTGQTLAYSFATTADFSVPGPHTVTAAVSYALDLDPANDALTAVIANGPPEVTTYPFVATFDGLTAPGDLPPAGWAQDPADASGNFADWSFTNTVSATTAGGPTTDASGGGYFAYVDDAGEHAAVILRSPCLDLGALVSPRLSFYLWSNNANPSPTSAQAMFSIDVISLTTGMVTTDAFGPVGHLGAAWNYQFLDLLPWFSERIQLVFRVNSANGSSLHDIALDEIAVYDPLPTPGQGPQPGLAVMDINDARNGNLEPTFVPGNGPYYASAQVGGLIAFEFEGEPNRPIVLLSGPLNPVAATFPNVGQFDIGGPIDPLTGIPTALIVLADGGNAQGLNAFFVLSAAGRSDIGFGVPNLPLGLLGSFQAAIFTSGANGAPVALSNAIQLTLN